MLWECTDTAVPWYVVVDGETTRCTAVWCVPDRSTVGPRTHVDVHHASSLMSVSESDVCVCSVDSVHPCPLIEHRTIGTLLHRIACRVEHVQSSIDGDGMALLTIV